MIISIADPTDKQGQFARACWELIAEGSLTKGEAVKMFREEYNASLTYMLAVGILTYFDTATAEHNRREANA